MRVLTPKKIICAILLGSFQIVTWIGCGKTSLSPSQHIEFVRMYGESSSFRALDFEADPMGGWFILAGTGTVTPGQPAKLDLLKTGPTGIINWQTNIKTFDQDTLFSLHGAISVEPSGSVLVTGFTTTSRGFRHAFVTRCLEEGNLDSLESPNVGGAAILPWDILSTEANGKPGYVLTGSSIIEEDSDILVAYADPNGNIQWWDTLGFSQADYPARIIYENSRYYILGSSQKNQGGEYDLIVIILDDNGNTLGFTYFNSIEEKTDLALDMQSTSEGFIIAASSFAELTVPNAVVALDNENIRPTPFVLSINKEGQELWRYAPADSGAKVLPRALADLGQGQVVILGETSDSLFIQRLSKDQQSKRIGLGKSVGIQGNEMLEVPDDGLILTGTIETNGFKRITLIKINAAGIPNFE